MAKSKLARFKAKRKAKANPEKKEAIELASNIGAGFAGYAATRLLSRMAFSQAVKRFPKAAEHVHVAASALGAAGVYFGSKHWSKIDDYHEAAAIGAGIALLQTTMQTYLPKFGWVVADVNAGQYNAAKKKVLPAADIGMLPEHDEGLDDFDLDALLASDNSIEAVQIGQAPSVEEEVIPDFMPADYGDDLEHYNGMLN